MKKLIIITGYESTGSCFTSQIISFVLGKCHNFGDWDGHGWNGEKGDDLIILHRSMPHFRKPKRWFDELAAEIDGMDDYEKSYIICTRDLNISKTSRIKRWRGSWAEYQKDDDQASEIFASLIKSQKTFIFSLETAIALKDSYYAILYEWLGVQSDFFPPIYDANAPYIKTKLRRVFAWILGSKK